MGPSPLFAPALSRARYTTTCRAPSLPRAVAPLAVARTVHGNPLPSGPFCVPVSSPLLLPPLWPALSLPIPSCSALFALPLPPVLLRPLSMMHDTHLSSYTSIWLHRCSPPASRRRGRQVLVPVHPSLVSRPLLPRAGSGQRQGAHDARHVARQSPIRPLYPPFLVACPSGVFRSLASLRVPSLPCARYRTRCRHVARTFFSTHPPLGCPSLAPSAGFSPFPALSLRPPSPLFPRGPLWSYGPMVLLARPSSPFLPCPPPLPTLCRTLYRQFARTLQARPWPLLLAADWMRCCLSDSTRRLPTTATAPARAAVADCHSKCRGGRGPDKPRLPPG